MKGHSGMDRIQEVEDQIIKIEDQEIKKLNELVLKEHELLFRLAEMSLALEVIKKDALESRKLRDQYCLMLEERYGISPGTRWDFNKEKGGLVVRPTKPIVRDIVMHPKNDPI